MQDGNGTLTEDEIAEAMGMAGRMSGGPVAATAWPGWSVMAWLRRSL
jgi:alkylhydroperoxidase/carboxymuconolactone decarboxylase family protein YurZ